MATQPSTATTAQLRSYLQLLRTVVPVYIGRGGGRANGTATVYHLVDDVNDGRGLCGVRVLEIQGEVAAATSEPHFRVQCPRCWVELGRAALRHEAQQASHLAPTTCRECALEGHTGNHEEHGQGLLAELLASGQPLVFVEGDEEPQESVREYNRRMHEAQQATRWAVEVLEADDLHASWPWLRVGERMGPLSLGEADLLAVEWRARGWQARVVELTPEQLAQQEAREERPADVSGEPREYVAYQSDPGWEPEPGSPADLKAQAVPPLLAAARALGLSDCAPGCTCRGNATTTTPSMLADASVEA